MNTLFYNSFFVTFAVLMATSFITIVEALKTPLPFVRHILNLESAISLCAGYFYSIFISKIESTTEIDWAKLTIYRYVDWSITTPMMLLALCLVLSNNIGVTVNVVTYISIILLNYLMLGIGFVGETGGYPREFCAIIGFIPFILMFWLIYATFVKPKKSMANNVLFGMYLLVWSLYGVVYLLGEEEKNMATNVLDMIAKCLIGLGLWVYYTKIISV